MLLFVNRLRLSLSHKELSAVAVHCALVAGVAAYAIGGAVIMRKLEKSGDETSNDRNRREIASGGYHREVIVDDKSSYITPVPIRDTDTFTGAQLAEMEPGLHDCVMRALETMFNATNCEEQDLDSYIIAGIDECYQQATLSAFSDYEDDGDDSQNPEQWSFADALIFTFTVITTIGYGNVAPVTVEGRIFLLIYGLIGVPLTLLTIADLGLFLSKMLSVFTGFAIVYVSKAKTFLLARLKSPKVGNKKNNVGIFTKTTANNDCNERTKQDTNEQEDVDVNNNRETLESIVLAVAFFAYLFIGAYLISCYEPELDFFKAFYFNFVTLTTVGLGDFVPKRESYLFITMLYTTFGLALTTLTVQIAAEYLKKLHYFGRKIENVANVYIWFGGKKMSVKNLVKYLGDQLDIPVDQMKHLNLDEFVNSAIQVENGELKTLRKPELTKVMMRPRREKHPVSYRDLRKSSESENIRYMDERTSIATSGDDFPTAEDVGRSVRSVLYDVDESLALPQIEYIPRRPYTKERPKRNSRIDSSQSPSMRFKRYSPYFQS